MNAMARWGLTVFIVGLVLILPGLVEIWRA